MSGIYIHIPFCKSRCKYCDFFSTTQLHLRNDYVQALLMEWRDRQHQLTEPVETIYLGGGTPSTLSLDHLQTLLQELRSTLHRDEVASPLPLHSTPSTLHRASGAYEITLEANPGDITPELAQAWRALGINRLSIGIQSFHDDLLRLIGRRHTAQQAIEAVRTAQLAGFDNISIDLMYALPTQTMQQWQHDVQTALQLGVQHLSSYGLIYEDDTPLTNMLLANQIQATDEDLEMQMYDYLVEQLTANGFLHYEVSNFALPGRHSRHNSSYWCDIPYLGLGAGAHSYDGQARRSNISDLQAYIRDAMTHSLQPETELLTPEQKHTERVMLALRTSHGVAISDIDIAKAEPFIAQGLLCRHGDRLAATTRGFHILNRIIAALA